MLLLSVILLLCLSAFFSGTETAVMALDRYQVRTLSEEGDTHAYKLMQYLKDPERFFAVVLLGNTFANIAAASIFTIWVQTLQGELMILSASIAFPIAVLLFCEFWPKSFAARYALPMSMRVVGIIRMVEWLFYPLLFLMRIIMRVMNRTKQKGERLTIQELRRVIRAAGSQLSIEEQDMLEGVLDLSQLVVEDVMLPKHAATVLVLSQPWDEVIAQLKATTAHYILVVSDRKWTEVLGILYLKDIALDAQDLTATSMKRKLQGLSYVQQGTPLNTQLANFKKKRSEVSIVVDEYGDELGVIDVHDIVEEVVGYYANRRAIPIGSVRFDGSQGYWVRTDVVTRDLNRYLNWDLPEEEATSIGGLILKQLGQLPDGPCAFMLENYRVEVTDIRNNRLILSHIHTIMPEDP